MANYSTVVSSVITAFDNIYNALKAKSVSSSDDEEILLPAVENSGILVSRYPDFIINQLYRVSGVLSSADIVSSSGIISNYSGRSSTTLNNSYTYDSSTESGTRNIIASGNGLSAGYYSPTSTISMTIPGKTLSISGVITSDAEWDVEDNEISYVPVSDIITKVLIYRGLVNNTIKTAEFATTISAGLVYDSTDLDAYSISVDLTNASKEAVGVIDPGYIKETSYNVSINSSPKVFTIPKGNAIVSSGTPTVGLSFDSTVLMTTAVPTGEYYTISSNVSSALSASTFKAGYFKNIDSLSLTGLSHSASTVYYMPKASAVFSTNLDYVLVDADDGKEANSGTTETPVYILSSTVPESGDYYKITSSISQESLSEGYLVNNGITYSGTKDYYLPKAIMSYVENSESGNYIQVSTGGYIPSGIIKDIAVLSGIPDFASVELNFINPDGTSLIHTTQADGDYIIQLSKGLINAGYISQSEGTLNGIGYITHGSVNSNVSLTNLSADENPTWNSTTSKYEINISATPSVTSTTTVPGYIKSSDVTITPDSEQTSVISLNKAILTAETQDTEGSTNISLTSSGVGVTLGENTSSYYIEYGIEPGAKIRARASSTGYIESGSVSSDVLLTNIPSKFYLNEATLSSPDTSNAKVLSYSDNYSTTQAGDYTITANLSASAAVSVSEGYIPAAGLSDSIAVTGTDVSIKVPHGAISTSVSGESILVGSGTTVETANYLLSSIPSGENASDYISLISTALGTEVGTISTSGYIKQADFVSDAENKLLGTVTKYIRLFTNSVIDDDTQVSKKLNTYTLYSVSDNSSYSSSSAIIETEGTFSQNNLKVSIDTDSMGNSVYDKIVALKNRLEGISA